MNNNTSPDNNNEGFSFPRKLLTMVVFGAIVLNVFEIQTVKRRGRILHITTATGFSFTVRFKNEIDARRKEIYLKSKISSVNN